MAFNSTPVYPNAGCYVLKLHRDAAPQRGQLCGRLEHIASGATIDFADGHALLTWLQLHAAQLHATSTTITPIRNEP